jgi:site-specific DNA-methyltransferase (adenine-specific)
MTPYYQDSAVTIYHGDCECILPCLPKSDLLLTDPPYGISQCGGMGGGGFDSTGRYPRKPRQYEGGWDKETPSREAITLLLASARHAIIWGGNYLCDRLPKGNKWFVWDKEQVMPTYSDAEMAFTTLPGDSIKMFRYGVNRHRADETRQHPTQKPVMLMQWCIQMAGAVETIVDPFAGSGSTGEAAKNLGKRCVLIEREERYCEIGAKRMAQEVLPLVA